MKKLVAQVEDFSKTVGDPTKEETQGGPLASNHVVKGHLAQLLTGSDARCPRVNATRSGDISSLVSKSRQLSLLAVQSGKGRGGTSSQRVGTLSVGERSDIDGHRLLQFWATRRRI